MYTLNQLQDIQAILLHTREVVSHRVAEGRFNFVGLEEVNTGYGLCSAVTRVYRHLFPSSRVRISSWLRRTWVEWEEYSGVYSYPVPHPELNPSLGYDITTNMWDKRTHYGKARRRLLDWLILQVAQQIKEIENV